MISMTDYVGKWAKSPDWTPARQANAQRLLTACNALEAIAVKAGIKFPVNPKTKSPISGEQYGGFRPQDCPQGSPGSAHKEGLAVDRFDPFGAIDNWLLTEPEAQKAARQLGIYFEHPKHTTGWSHWTIRKPASGNLFFKP